MLIKSLLDTDVLSEIGKGLNPTVTGNARVYQGVFGRYTTTTVTVMEIIRGFQRIGGARRLQAFVASFALLEILPFDQPAAELAGRIAGDLERAGMTIGLVDPMIAAVALTQGLELVTGNMGHFQRIQQLGYPLTLANWRL